MAFIDLPKAFDLVNRSGLFKLLEKIGYISFHKYMNGGVFFEGQLSAQFFIRGV